MADAGPPSGKGRAPAAAAVRPPAAPVARPASPGGGIARPGGEGLRLSRGSLDAAARRPTPPAGVGGELPSHPGGSAAWPLGLDAPKARATGPPTRRGGDPGVARGAVSRAGKKGARIGATLVFVDETGFYLLPFVVLTYAPRGWTPVLAETLTRDHLSVISGVTPQGQLFLQSYEDALTGTQVVRFLRHLQQQLPGPLIVIWDGATIHRNGVVQAFLASQPAGWLQLVEAVELALLFEQLGVGADFLDLPVLQHDQAVGVAEGAEPVGDGEGGAALDEPGDGVLDLLLGVGIDGGRGLVQDQDARIV